MPTAICTTCNKTRHWENRRGSKLSDLKCDCGGRFCKAEFESHNNRWVVPQKKEKLTCNICSRPGLFPGQMIKLHRSAIYLRQQTGQPHLTLEAGAAVCSWHKQWIIDKEPEQIRLAI